MDLLADEGGKNDVPVGGRTMCCWAASTSAAANRRQRNIQTSPLSQEGARGGVQREGLKTLKGIDPKESRGLTDVTRWRR
jgi:hypothetical protein